MQSLGGFFGLVTESHWGGEAGLWPQSVILIVLAGSEIFTWFQKKKKRGDSGKHNESRRHLNYTFFGKVTSPICGGADGV